MDHCVNCVSSNNNVSYILGVKALTSSTIKVSPNFFLLNGAVALILGRGGEFTNSQGEVENDMP